MKFCSWQVGTPFCFVEDSYIILSSTVFVSKEYICWACDAGSCGNAPSYGGLGRLANADGNATLHFARCIALKVQGVSTSMGFHI